jgi:hypothetical protein
MAAETGLLSPGWDDTGLDDLLDDRAWLSAVIAFEVALAAVAGGVAAGRWDGAQRRRAGHRAGGVPGPDEGGRGADRWRELCDPAGCTGAAGVLVNRALGRYRDQPWA